MMFTRYTLLLLVFTLDLPRYKGCQQDCLEGKNVIIRVDHYSRWQ